MSCSRFVVAGLVAAVAALVGCSSEESAVSKDEGLTSALNDLQVLGAQYVGEIKSGETKSAEYSTPPTYRAYGFEARGGDTITVSVKSVGGDAIAFLADTNYNVIVSNDDADRTTLDSRVTYQVPAAESTRPYRIVFRDYELTAGTFEVSLAIKPGPTMCAYQNQSYPAGSQFLASDGCNTCTCESDGTVSCTARACVPTCNPAAEPNNHYVGTPQECMVIRYTCREGQVPFSNPCGCGCQDVP